MPFRTINGLKIRLDAEGVSAVLAEPRERRLIDLEDIMLNTELWVNLPQALSAVAAIIVAAATASATWTIIVSFFAYAIGDIIAHVWYSPLLRKLFPQFLGSWLITLPAAIVIVVLLLVRGHWLPALTLIIVVPLNVAEITSIVSLPLLIVTVPLRRALGLDMGMAEFAFTAACEEAAWRSGVELDWTLYDHIVACKSEELWTSANRADNEASTDR